MPTKNQQPDALCICGHKRSEHRVNAEWRPVYCRASECDCPEFRLDPAAIAPGWNPDRLTQAQVGAAEGWRLLSEDESSENDTIPETQVWWGQSWGRTARHWCDIQTARTRLSRAELRAARGLAPESEQTAPLNTSDQQTLDRMRVAVATALGWELVSEQDGDTVFVHPDHGFAILPDRVEYNGIPNYPASLDAMHEAEKTISGSFLMFESHLKEICLRDWRGTEGDQPYCNSFPVHATALQRCLAFLATKNITL